MYELLCRATGRMGMWDVLCGGLTIPCSHQNPYFRRIQVPFLGLPNTQPESFFIGYGDCLGLAVGFLPPAASPRDSGTD